MSFEKREAAGSQSRRRTKIRLTHLLASLVVAGTLIGAILIPDGLSNPCEFEGKIDPGCTQPIERDNRFPLRLALGITGAAVALGILVVDSGGRSRYGR